MIAELYLILDLLGDTVGDTPISPPPTSQPKPIATKTYGVTTQSGNGLGGGLFEVGETTEIKQQVIIPPISPADYPQWWLDATEGIPVTSLPPGVRPGQ